MSTFKDDERVLVWDVYNEPNIALTFKDGELVERVFAWARAAQPTQPLTLAVWRYPQPNVDLILKHTDVYSFHGYLDEAQTEKILDAGAALGRPVLCTEWLNRPQNSTVADILPLFFERNIGSFFWGLVNGKTQTHYPWKSEAGAPEPEVWQHDIFRNDRTPYDEDELALFRHYLNLAARRKVAEPLVQKGDPV